MFKNLILLAAATSAVVFAQTVPALNAQLVKTGLYVITGAGCNSVLRLSANGFILVDGGLPGNYDVLMKKVDRKSTRLNSRHRCIAYAFFCLRKGIRSETYPGSTAHRHTSDPTSPSERRF